VHVTADGADIWIGGSCTTVLSGVASFGAWPL